LKGRKILLAKEHKEQPADQQQGSEGHHAQTRHKQQPRSRLSLRFYELQVVSAKEMFGQHTAICRFPPQDRDQVAIAESSVAPGAVGQKLSFILGLKGTIPFDYLDMESTAQPGAVCPLK